MKNKFGQYYKRKPIKPALRQAVYERDNFTCQYCGFHASEKELEIDHIVPVSRGGTNDIDNLRTSCSKCNKKKGAKLERSIQVPDINKKLGILAEVLDTTVAYLSGETDTPQRKQAEDENMHSPAEKSGTALKNPSFIREGDFIGSGRVLMY